jgi:hypothetical protein
MDIVVSEVLYSLHNHREAYDETTLSRGALLFYKPEDITKARDDILKLVPDACSASLPKERRGPNKVKSELTDIFYVLKWAEEKQHSLPSFASVNIHHAMPASALILPVGDARDGVASSMSLVDIRQTQLEVKEVVLAIQRQLAECRAFETSRDQDMSGGTSDAACGTHAVQERLLEVRRSVNTDNENLPRAEHAFDRLKRRSRPGAQLKIREGTKNLIIADSQTRFIIPRLLDSSGQTQIWTRRGGTIDSVTHELMNSTKDGVGEANEIENVILFVSGNTIACGKDSDVFMHELETLMDQLGAIFPNAQVCFADFIPRKDVPSPTQLESLRDEIVAKYGLQSFLRLEMTPGDVGDDGIHLNREGLRKVCQAFQIKLGVHGGETEPFTLPQRFSGPPRGGLANPFSVQLSSELLQTRNDSQVHQHESQRQGDDLAGVPRPGTFRRKRQLLLTNLLPTCTLEKVKSKIGSGVIRVLDTSRNPTWSRSFLVTLDEEAFLRCRVSSYWPPNVFVKRYYPPRGEL